MNFEDNATRKTGALSYLLYTSFGVSTNNAIEGAKFVNAKPVYFPPMERKWGNDNGGGTAYRTAVIHDRDGSFGGGPNSYILINDGVNDSIAADAEACEIKPDLERCRVQGRCRTPEFGGPGGGCGGFGGFGARGRGAPRAGGAGRAQLAGRGGAAGPGAGARRSGAAGRARWVPAVRAKLALVARWRWALRRSAAAGHPQPPVVLSRNGKEYT